MRTSTQYFYDAKRYRIFHKNTQFFSNAWYYRNMLHILSGSSRLTSMQYIYLINQARGPYSENIGPGSWQYGPSAARSVQKRPRADILLVRSGASLVNKRFITRLKKAKTQGRDHSGQCPVQYLENIGPAIFMVHPGWSPCNTVAEWVGICNELW